MGKHENKSTGNGQGDFDPSRSKDVQDAGGGRHSEEDKGDQGGQRDEDDHNK